MTTHTTRRRRAGPRTTAKRLMERRIELLSARQDRMRHDLAHILAKRKWLEAKATEMMIARYGRAVLGIIERPKRSDAKHMRWLKRRLSDV